MKVELNPHMYCQKVGLLGGGQLALMMGESLINTGAEVIVYAQDLSEPACTIANNILIGQQNDSNSLRVFFSYCDIVILENEFYSPHILQDLIDDTGVKTIPDIRSYDKLFSKIQQKTFFKESHIPYTPYEKVLKQQDLSLLINFSGPYIVKRSHGGYDGYGNQEVADLSLITDFSHELIIEKKLDLKQEYSCLLVKNDTDTIIFDPCKTYQRNHCCEIVEMCPEIDVSITSEIKEMVKRMAEGLPGKGVYAFEFFETQGGTIYINEAAPRVHNSYHFSTEAYDKGQFDYISELILNHKLVAPEKKYDYLSMINLLGSVESLNYQLNFPHIEGEYEYKIHLYGKKESRPGRKMGHIILFGNKKNIEIAKRINQEYTI